jgi:redox-sensitive bicupin YhaK (pirin superfamily)
MLPLDPSFEYALVVLSGKVRAAAPGGAGQARVTPGELAYLGLGRDELELTATEPVRLLLLGGVPFESPILMWWNFVARDRAEMQDARADWEADAAGVTGRFGMTGSSLARIPAPPIPWATGG